MAVVRDSRGRQLEEELNALCSSSRSSGRGARGRQAFRRGLRCGSDAQQAQARELIYELEDELAASERYAARAAAAGQSLEYIRARRRADQANSAIDEILGQPPGQQQPV